MPRFLSKAGWLAGAVLILRLGADVCESGVWASTRQITRFHHTMWTSDNGLGAVFDIQQASSGYLWLTTSTGVFRFDGVRFQSVEEVTNGAVEDSQIHSAFLSSSGGVWLKTRAAGLLFWKDGHLSVFNDRRCTPALQMEGLAEDQDGALWIQGSGGLFLMRGSACEQVGTEHGYPGGFPAAILVDRKGTVWVRTLAGDLLFLPRGQSRFQRIEYAAGPISAAFVLAAPTHNAFLHQAPDGAIWLSDDYGLRRVTNSAGAPVVTSPPGKGRRESIQFGDFTFAADGSLWAASDRGVRRFDHVEQWQTPIAMEDSPGERFTTEQGLSSNAAWKVLIDRESSVWVGTNAGLDQLRGTTLTALVLPQTEEHDFGVAAGDGSSVWTGNRSMPLTRVAADISITTFPETHGTVCLRRDRNGTIWSAGGGDSQLWRYSATGLTSLHYPEQEAGPVISLAVDRNGDPWITTGIGGTYHFSLGAWNRQNETLGKKPGIIGAMAGDDAGNVWFGFSNNLVRWDGSAYQRFSFPNGARGVSESTMSVRGDHVWLGGSGGIELFTQGHFCLLHWKDQHLPGRVSGVVETETGELWANGSSGITHVSAAELARWLGNPTSAISAEHLAALDGLPGYSAERIPEPSVVESREGRLWFATTKGIAWLDPAKLQENRNRIPPPVMISAIFANGKTYAASHDLTLPAHTEKLQIDYTALSLAIPERVLFRYKLDGVDDEWQDAGTRRQAFYTSLPPGHYRFHVIACNNDGVWNEVGASVDFSIAPAWYQTIWFRGLCVLAFFTLLWAAYRMRVHQLQEQEKKFRDAVETMPALAFVADPDGNRTFFNRGWLEYTGLSSEQASGSGWEVAVHPEDLKRLTERWLASRTTGQPLDYEARLRRGSDGVYRWFQTRARPLRDDRGKIVNWCAVSNDIEDRKRAEQLQANLAHISRVNAMGELVASISHELAQPIMASTNNARASLRWLQRDPPELTRVREGTEKIIEAGGLAAEIIDRLRSLYKKSSPKRELVAINEVVGEMAGMMRGEARGHGVSIRTDLKDDLPMTVADRVQLQQVLMNLLLNGIEAMSETGGVLTVKSQLDEDGQIEILVSDTGPGLPLGKDGQIFDAFFTTKPQGSGMGLAISKSIVESHGGRIWANGDGGRGATFHFTLPAAPPETNPPMDAAGQSASLDA